MKHTFFLLIFTITQLAISQERKTGIIKDADTKEPLEFVSVYIDNGPDSNYTGSISNGEGEFSIMDNGSKVTFSYLGYEENEVELQEGFNEIFLKPKDFVLDEVVISDVSAEDYLKSIIKAADNKIDKNTLFKSYCREIVKVNDEYTKFSDGLVNYYVKKGNGKSVITLPQHRAFKSDKISEEDFGSIDNINSAFTLDEYVKNAYNYKFIKKLLKDKNYDFVRKIKKEEGGLEYEYIEVSPKSDVEELLYKGYVVIDPKTGDVLELKFYTSSDHLKYSKLQNVMLIMKVKVNSLLIWTKFRVIEDKYVLTYNQKSVGMYLKFGKYVDDNFNFSSDLFVYAFENDVEIPDDGYDNRTIYEAGTSFTENFWENYNAFPLNNEEEAFIESVSK
ncbi:carboxypeptidase-like regulatory domain-containing protein [Mangrovimonas sp. AS39]|uniref:carboxypeptidase-like regulatory domain-containing protein n=1 Tax=Mangrovimonas futianensis TaxID=2895523 RepID=UPI001E43176D|nr:carboxypeptidase-like regulatory domain-containing protein [Mangrovimonas futianensis]MCF1191603.1 carboxypeptidase-like regulatory domain-containing protein [Mangrovimonas futianensis]MCF1195509.1 carboxypeptidase-like regulatory domain-containing protein [Mangrovimonas futianensis]